MSIESRVVGEAEGTEGRPRWFAYLVWAVWTGLCAAGAAMIALGAGLAFWRVFVIVIGAAAILAGFVALVQELRRDDGAEEAAEEDEGPCFVVDTIWDSPRRPSAELRSDAVALSELIDAVTSPAQLNALTRAIDLCTNAAAFQERGLLFAYVREER
jgi:hypothetical protein